MELNLENFNREHAKFCAKAFPNITDYRAPLKHLKKEVKETMVSGEPDEYADCLMLLLSSFRLKYPHCDTHDLLRAAAAKLEINKSREWEMNSEGFAEHKR